jgi:3-oxoacyl-[acyl-carrier protein] reductase
MSAAPVSVVTGASRGIGARTARLLAEAGHRLVLVARGEGALREVARECESLGASVVVHAADLTDPEAVAGIFRSILQQEGRVDTLVNAAGAMSDAAIAMTKLDVLESLLRVNVHATFQCCQLASRLMLRQRSGSIVNVASKVGESGSAGQAAYAASKAAISGLTKSLAKELGPSGIRVNAVAPGFIETDLTAYYGDEARRALVDRIALRRLGQADDVARVIRFLASGESAYVTGQVIGVDGGFVL